MKKKSEGRMRGFFNRIINVRYWSDFERTKSGFTWLLVTIKNIFIPTSKKMEESFEAAKIRLGLTEKIIEKRKKMLFILSMVMLGFAIGLLGYSLYNLIFGFYMASFISFVVTIIALTLFYRYHFWFYQLKVRRLGCSIGEWFYEGVLGKKL